MGGRVSSITFRVVEEIDTGSENDIFGGQSERTDSGEEMGVIAEAMGIHPTPHTPKTDSGAGIKGAVVGWNEHGLLVTGGNRWDTRGRRGRVEKDRLIKKHKNNLV